jgi:FtsH-binding integral membrane protein
LAPDAMRGGLGSSTDTVSQRAAMILLAVFLAAVVGALVFTLYAVAASVRPIATAAVAPVIALTLLCLYFEIRRRRWAFAGAAALGVLGVTLRLVVNTQPQLEVGGGLPLWVTVLYVAIGTLVTATSLWALLTPKRDGRTETRRPKDGVDRT